jgi:hypothetical protein
VPALGLTIIDLAGQLQIRWNHQAESIRKSDAALLLIADEGVPPQAIGLDRPRLDAGSFLYVRRGGRVEVRLTVHEAGGPDVSEVATFLGQPPVSIPPAGAAAAKEEGEALERDAARKTEAARRKKLENTIEELRTQLKKAQQRKRLENQSPDSVK